MKIRYFFKEEIATFKKCVRLLSEFKSFKRKIAIIVLFEIAAILIFLAYPFLSKPLIDVGVLKKNFVISLILGGLCGVFYLIHETAGVLRDFFSRKYQNRLIFSISKKVVCNLYSLDLSFFQSSPSLNQVLITNYYLNQVVETILVQIPRLIAILTKITLLFLICFWLDFKMTLPIVSLAPIIIYYKLFFVKRDRILSYDLELKCQEISLKLIDSFSKIQIVKYFSKERHQIRKFLQTLVERIRIKNKLRNLNLKRELSARFLTKIAAGLIFLLGFYRANQDLLSFGTLSALMLYYHQILLSIKDMDFHYTKMSRTLFSIDRYFDTMAKRTKIQNPPKPLFIDTIKGKIEFKNLSFEHNPAKSILKNVNFQIESGKWVTLVGKSGVGKTTIFNLILRLFDPLGGSITLDGHNINKFNLSFLTKNIRIAPQEPILFNCSLEENITFPLNKKNKHKMIEAAKICGIHDYINSLPKKYETIIQRNGTNLSRGQRQRIALTRSIIDNPPVLILDETISSLDPDTRRNVYKNLKNLRSKLTTIIASHCLSTINLTNYVIFIKNAEEILAGNYQQLLKEDEQFFNLFGKDMLPNYLHASDTIS